MIAVSLLVMTATAICEHAIWDCPECGRTGNKGKFCGECGHPAPLISENSDAETGKADVKGKTSERIKTGIICLDPSDSGYQEKNVQDMMETFTDENGYDAKIITTSIPEKQLEAFKGFVKEGLPYILLSPVYLSGWEEALREAKDSGIKVFLFDRVLDCDPELYTAAVVSDFSEQGKKAVEWLESQNLKEYRVLHIQGDIGSWAQIGRSGFLNEKAASEENWTIVHQESANWDYDEARRITQKAIDSGEKFNIVYAETDIMTAGAVEVLDTAGITHGVNGDVTIVSFDCNKWALEELLAGEWNYDGQFSPFQAAPLDEMIKTIEAGETIEGLNDSNIFILDERGFDARTITQNDVDMYGL